MHYDAWPSIQKECPVCGGAGCAIYRGYYCRKLYCSELEYFGLIVIRTGVCKSTGLRFSLLPSFILRHKRISSFCILALHDLYFEVGSKLQQAIDEFRLSLFLH